METLKGKLSDAFKNEDCYTIEEMSKEIGVTPIRTRQLLTESLKRRLIQNLSKKEGVRVLYPEPMVKRMVEIYESGKIAKPRKNRTTQTVASITKNAKMLLEVPVFDESIKDILLKQFGSQDKIIEHLKTSLTSVAKPVLKALNDLEREYDTKRRQIMQHSL